MKKITRRFFTIAIIGVLGMGGVISTTTPAFADRVYARCGVHDRYCAAEALTDCEWAYNYCYTGYSADGNWYYIYFAD
jgi:hypothetical protein